MERFGLTMLALMASGAAAQAGPFNKGIGSAMIYGPYTGGHGYSYNVAYSYGFAFSSADTWRRDPFAYPGGIYPYRPDGRPVYHRVFPKPRDGAAPISVPGEDGLPVLMHPGAVGEPTAALPVGTVSLKPVPAAVGTATIRIVAPAGAEVWVEKQAVPGGAAERTTSVGPLTEGRTHVYSLRATWNEGGKPVDHYRVVGVRAGETAKVDFVGSR